MGGVNSLEPIRVDRTKVAHAQRRDCTRGQGYSIIFPGGHGVGLHTLLKLNPIRRYQLLWY